MEKRFDTHDILNRDKIRIVQIVPKGGQRTIESQIMLSDPVEPPVRVVGRRRNDQIRNRISKEKDEYNKDK